MGRAIEDRSNAVSLHILLLDSLVRIHLCAWMRADQRVWSSDPLYSSVLREFMTKIMRTCHSISPSRMKMFAIRSCSFVLLYRDRTNSLREMSQSGRNAYLIILMVILCVHVVCVLYLDPWNRDVRSTVFSFQGNLLTKLFLNSRTALRSGKLWELGGSLIWKCFIGWNSDCTDLTKFRKYWWVVGHAPETNGLVYQFSAGILRKNWCHLGFKVRRTPWETWWKEIVAGYCD